MSPNKLKNSLPKDFKPKGDFYVFVDECHRTQSIGKGSKKSLNQSMKEILGDKAIFIGFTGTPIFEKNAILHRESNSNEIGKISEGYKRSLLEIVKLLSNLFSLRTFII